MNLKGDEIKLYESIFPLLQRDLRKPDLVVFLQSSIDRLMHNIKNRARKIERFLSQPFFVASQFTGLEGKLVSIEDTIKGFRMIMNGEVDQYPEAAFNLVGNIEEAIAKGEKLLSEN